MFNDILRQDNNDMKKLSFNVIKNLIQYLTQTWEFLSA